MWKERMDLHGFQNEFLIHECLTVLFTVKISDHSILNLNFPIIAAFKILSVIETNHSDATLLRLAEEAIEKLRRA